MSNQFKLLSEKQSQNLTQIVQNFFLRSAQIIYGSRENSPLKSSHSSSQISKNSNRWFNLDLESFQLPKSALSLWKGQDILQMPPLVVETVLDLRGLERNQTLIFDGENIVKTDKKAEIVLERWLVEFDLNTFDNDSVELPAIYKRMIVTFRSLYTLTLLLPAYNLREKLAGFDQASSSIALRARIVDGSQQISSHGRIGLSRDLTGHKGDKSHLISRSMEPVLTPIGALKISVSYRRSCGFEVRDNEEFISRQIESNITSLKGSLPSNESIPSITGRSHSSQRRSSLRSVPLFKAGSLATHLQTNASNTPNSGGSSSLGSKPIPVTLNRTNSSTTRKSSQNSPQPAKRENLFAESYDSLAAIRRHSHEGDATFMSSNSSKFASSFGSRFRSSIEGDSKNKITGVGSDSSNLSTFVKMMESKPDLNLGAGEADKDTGTKYDDSIRQFKKFQQSNKLFSQSPADKNRVASSLPQKSISVSPYSVNVMAGTSYSPARRRSSASSSYSPSLRFMKLAQASGPSNPTITPAVGYAERFLASSAGGEMSSSSLQAELLRQRSYKEQVFESDDEDDKKDEGKAKNAHSSRPKSMQFYRGRGSMERRRVRSEEEDDELLFTMSDMASARNNNIY